MTPGASTAEPRVLLDATALPAERGGVGRYVDCLVPALVAAGTDLTVVCQDRDVDLFTESTPAAVVLGAGPGVSARGSRLVWEQTGLPRLVRRLGTQVLHSPHYTMPLAARAASVVTLHDATFFSDGALHTTAKGAFFRTWTRTSLRRAAVCVVPSASARDELVRVLGVAPHRVMVAPHGVDRARFHPPGPGEVARVRRELGLCCEQPYVAFLGAAEPRKNLPALIDGWVQACAELAAGGHPVPALVVAGAVGWDDAVAPALTRVPAHLRVVRAGYVPVADLPGLLAGAAVVAYPSLGEGFGLPVLEAMASGACVLTTRRLSLPEVGGDAVAYTEVSAPAIAHELRRLLAAPAERARLSAAALTRAHGFEWAASARAHRAAYSLAAARAAAR